LVEELHIGVVERDQLFELIGQCGVFAAQFAQALRALTVFQLEQGVEHRGEA